MWRKIVQSWREIAGWIAIFVCSYYYVYYINYGVLAYRTNNFNFLAGLLLLILVWLRINKPKGN